MNKKKAEVISFKADQALAESLEGMPNRSQFIRDALLAALDGVCPLCRGTGILTPQQREHWERFSQGHRVERCGQCNALHLVCTKEESTDQGGQSPLRLHAGAKRNK